MGSDLFSRRYGFVPVRSAIQLESIDSDLRTDLWNVIYVCFFADDFEKQVDYTGNRYFLFLAMQRDFFREPIDDMPKWVGEIANSVKTLVLNSAWYLVFDLLDFFSANALDASERETLVSMCNVVLERELSGYRFVDGRIAPVATEIEVKAIEQALKDSQPIVPVHTHLNRALDLLADRQAPDYRNSIKESVSAVEALCILIASQPRATLGAALSAVEKRVKLHGALKGAFGQLYGYTSDASPSQ
jgi:hypothetical protein